MSLGRTILSPLFRSLAGLALGMFVVAQSMCFIHCHFGGGHGNSDAQPSCHSFAQAKSHNGHDAPASLPTASCSTFKTMLAEGEASTLIAPQLHTLYLLAPMTLDLDAIQVQPTAPFSGQVLTRDWGLHT